MVYVALGLNHKTAPIEIREQVATLPANEDRFLVDLMSCEGVHEAAVLSTCNRTEIYCEIEKPGLLSQWLARQHDLPAPTLKPYLYLHQQDNAIRHTLRVASGLDSMMLGEPQILGQMKQAYQHACQMGTVKHQLRNKFEYIFSASKRIRNQSGIGTNPISVAYAAVQLINQTFSDLQTINVLLIGSGETSRLVAKYLQESGVAKFMIASRTPENAHKLALAVDAQAINIGDIPTVMHQADVVVTATACPMPFINPSLIKNALTLRNNRPMFLLDLAVPRDIEPEVGLLNNAHLYNIDDLEKIIEDGMEARRTCAVAAEQLIELEVEQYIRWHRSLRASDMIIDYRQHMDSLAELELQRALKLIASGEDTASVMNSFKHRLVNKLVHQPTVGMRQAAWEGKTELLDLANYLFKPSTKSNSHEEIS
ncbi:glutamyl-tRNA reductase [Legionella sp. W05-934-2]|jgi:glutamyl-tRNA reductase|uniref:glutamyl-tRNA reductase n=1 Tax=Legionella sp. W05-934-2 TaxID=1198649 RepID=UPI0034628644